MNKKYFINLIALLICFILFTTQSCYDDPYFKGRVLYNGYCSNCHMEDGSGLAALIPPLTDIDYLKENIARIPCSIKYGIETDLLINGIVYNEEMPENIALTDTQITEILNYVLKVLNNSKMTITDDQVRESLAGCR